MFCWNKNFKLQPELLVLQREHLFLLPELPFTQTMISDFKIACNIYFVPWCLSIQLVSCWLLVWLLQQCWTLNTFGGMTTIILLFLAFTIFFVLYRYYGGILVRFIRFFFFFLIVLQFDNLVMSLLLVINLFSCFKLKICKIIHMFFFLFLFSIYFYILFISFFLAVHIFYTFIFIFELEFIYFITILFIL